MNDTTTLSSEDRESLAQCKQMLWGHLKDGGAILGMAYLLSLPMREATPTIPVPGVLLYCCFMVAYMYFGWRESVKRHDVFFALSLRGVGSLIQFRYLTAMVYGVFAAPMALIGFIRDVRAIKSFKASLGIGFFARHPEE